MHQCSNPFRALVARRSERGASFLEVLVSFSILLLLVLFVIELYPSALFRQRLVEGRQIGLSVADQELQAALCAPSAQLRSGWSRQYQLSREGRALSVNSQASADGATGLVHIRISVSWFDRTVNRSVTREAYLDSHST